LGSQVYLADGGRYDPVADRWAPMSNQGAPPSRALYWTIRLTGVWTGTELIVWQGQTGGRYDPRTDHWEPLPPLGEAAPPGREQRFATSAVWTGREFLVIWDADPYEARSGSRWDPASDQWTRFPVLPASFSGMPRAQPNVAW